MLTLRRPYDLHVHLRQAMMLREVLHHTVDQCAGALIMPNLTPPILTGEDAVRYREEILGLLTEEERLAFQPLMTIKLTDKTTPAMIYDAKKAGVIAGKLYPVGVTTNAHDGVRNATARHMHEVYTAMAEARMVLCLHGETPGEFVLDRETRFLSSLAEIAKTHPTLKIVLEHVTTADAVEWILRYQGNNVAATITAHHLDLTLDDVIGDMLRPHHFCKPVAKRPEDRQALWNAIQRGNPRFFLGSDSAPHLRIMKEHAEGCAGVFTAPILLPLLATLFERRTCLDLLESFTSTHGAAFYGLPLSDRKVKLERQPMTVPFEYSDVMDSGVVPLYAGKTLPWRLVV